MKSRDFPLDHSLADDLTWREQDVLFLLAERLSNREIASQLHLAESTVKDYVGKICDKLYANNRREAVERAKTLGLFERSRKALAGPAVHLPAENTPFVGRLEELKSIRRYLGETRLLTLTGPGGIGKTRLALKAAEEAVEDFVDGCFFVSFAPIRSPELIVQTVAEAIQFPISTQDDPLQQLLRYLQNRQTLLVMDNFEHLITGVDIVSQILKAAPSVRVLVTSRERLNLQSETTLTVEGMTFPGQAGAEESAGFESIALFLQCARKIRPGFEPSPTELEQIAGICQTAQGMPLAIELTAAWLHVLNIHEIVEELQQGLDILTTQIKDVPERHRSIRAAFDQSLMLLDPAKQEIFTRLSVFRGGFTREAAQQVAGASTQVLSDLVNKSLIKFHSSASRFEIHELLRQYAQERLEENPQAHVSVHQAHHAFFADFTNSQWEQLQGSQQTRALRELKADIENIRTSLRSYIDQANAAQLQKYINSLWLLYWMQGWNNAAAELFGKMAAALSRVRGGEVETVRAMAMANQAFFLAWIGRADQGYPLVNESIDMLERLH